MASDLSTRYLPLFVHKRHPRSPNTENLKPQKPTRISANLQPRLQDIEAIKPPEKFTRLGAHPSRIMMDWRKGGSLPARRTSAPDPIGEKYVRIEYICGGFVSQGPQSFPYSRLRRFSKRARRELREAGANCPPGGTITWTVHMQHYEQRKHFESIFTWFESLPNEEPKTGFADRNEHPSLDGNDWVQHLNWLDLFLLDHTLDYMHPREPLDNRKIRSRVWETVEGDKITSQDLHMVWHLLKCKSRWIEEAATFDPHPDLTSSPPSTTHSRGGSRQVSSSSTSTINEQLSPSFETWDPKNSALMLKVLRKVVSHIRQLDKSPVSFEAFITDIKQEALAHGEDYQELIEALTVVRDETLAHANRAALEHQLKVGQVGHKHSRRDSAAQFN